MRIERSVTNIPLQKIVYLEGFAYKGNADAERADLEMLSDLTRTTFEHDGCLFTKHRNEAHYIASGIYFADSQQQSITLTVGQWNKPDRLEQTLSVSKQIDLRRSVIDQLTTQVRQLALAPPSIPNVAENSVRDKDLTTTVLFDADAGNVYDERLFTRYPEQGLRGSYGFLRIYIG